MSEARERGKRKKRGDSHHAAEAPVEPDTEKQKKQKTVPATANKSPRTTTALDLATRIVPENAIEMVDSQAAEDQAPDSSFPSSSSVSSASSQSSPAGSTPPSVPSRQVSLQSRQWTRGVFEAHSLAVLQSQYAHPSSSLPIAGADDEVAEPRLNWKTALSEPPRSKMPGSHRTRRSKQLNLQLIHQCTSSWALDASLQRLITEFNSSGKDATLIEFTARRNEFFFVLLTYLNRFWAVITGTPKTLIVEHVESASSGSGHQAAVDYVIRSKASFRDVHENKLITVWTFNEQKAKILLTSVSLSELWRKSARRRACGAIVFDPRLPTSASESSAVSSSNFNLWRELRITRQAALAVRPTQSSRELQRAIQPFLDHIRIIWCREDSEAYAYCLNWMASLIQQPWRKLGVAIVLQGQPGSGKGIVITEFLAKIIGSHHFSHITGLDQICGQFNAPALATACLVFADEVMCSGNKIYAAKLKTLITESHHTLENKYVPSLSVESFTNYILSSNEDQVVPMEHKDRRYFALQTDNRFSGSQTAEKKSHFDRIMEVPVRLVAKYLYQLDVTDFNPREVPSTELQRAQKKLTLQPAGVDTWLLRCIEEGELPSGGMDIGATLQWDAVRLKAAVFEHYRSQAGAHPKPGLLKCVVAVRWRRMSVRKLTLHNCVALIVNCVVVAETFWRKLQEIIPCRTIQKRSAMWENKSVQMVQLPSLDKCKTAFRKHMADPKWSFQSEAAEVTGEDVEEENESQEQPSDSTADSQQIPAARTKEEIAKAEWDAVIAGLSVSCGGASHRKFE